MFSLVSRKFLAMRNIALYSVSIDLFEIKFWKYINECNVPLCNSAILKIANVLQRIGMDSCIDSESYQCKISRKKFAEFSCKVKPDQHEEFFHSFSPAVCLFGRIRLFGALDFFPTLLVHSALLVYKVGTSEYFVLGMYRRLVFLLILW